jgi:hypothetical protein
MSFNPLAIQNSKRVIAPSILSPKKLDFFLSQKDVRSFVMQIDLYMSWLDGSSIIL